MSLLPTTQARIDRIMAHVAFSGWSDDNLCMVRELILTSLREQDRDTRHACAEALCAVPVTRGLELMVPFSAAQSAVMNTCAI